MSSHSWNVPFFSKKKKEDRFVENLILSWDTGELVLESHKDCEIHKRENFVQKTPSSEEAREFPSKSLLIVSSQIDLGLISHGVSNIISFSCHKPRKLETL